ncbi:MAG: DUF58 domain-containing protein [Alphaproteobacteria bacterium]|nr:DUF58 domain-containing protein [Alphaproteobacteria bacterium]
MAIGDGQIVETRHGRWTRSGSVVSDLIVAVIFIVAIVGAAAGKLFVAALCGLVLVLVFVSRLWARLALVDVEYRCVASNDRLMVGDEFDLALTVENRKPLPLPWFSLTEFVPTGLALADGGPPRLSQFGMTEVKEVTSLGQYERITFHHRLKALSRGHYAFGPSRIMSGDIFGFYQATVEALRRPPGVVVYPRTVPLPDFVLPASRPIGDSLSQLQRVDDPTRPSGLREYRPGDPARRIDWKATARRDAVYVRTYDPSVAQRVVILVECDTSELDRWSNRPELLEAAVSGAASVAVRSVELGCSVGVVVNCNIAGGIAPPMVAPGAGPEQLTTIMTTLAGATSMTARPLESVAAEYGAEAIPFGATIVYVAGVFRSSATDFVIDLGRRGHPIVALYVGADDMPDIPNLPIQDYRSVFTVHEGADAD